MLCRRDDEARCRVGERSPERMDVERARSETPAKRRLLQQHDDLGHDQGPDDRRAKDGGLDVVLSEQELLEPEKEAEADQEVERRETDLTQLLPDSVVRPPSAASSGGRQPIPHVSLICAIRASIASSYSPSATLSFVPSVPAGIPTMAPAG